MRKLRLVVRSLCVVCILALCAAPVLADTSAEVTVTARPYMTTGITDFTITYISETQLDISWVFTGDAVNIMIRGQYGSYPDDIPDEDTEPTDGYLVYYGSETTASDTTMDFDQNPGILYYKAWAQKGDGKWYVNTNSGFEESAIVTWLGFILLAGIMSFLSIRSAFWLLKVMAGFTWWGGAIYWINNPPSLITKGDATDTTVIVLLIFIGIAFILMPFWYTKVQDGQEVGGRIRLPFMQTDEDIETERKRRYMPTRHERTSAYRERVNAATRGEFTRRR